MSALWPERSGGTRLSTVAAVVLALVAAAVATVTAVELISGADKISVVAPVAVCFLAAVAVIAVTRLEWFVLFVLAVRSSLDAIKLGQGTSGADPAAVLALMLFGTVVLWALIQRTQDTERQPWSPALKGVVVFAAVALVGIVTSDDPLTSAVEWLRLASAAPMLLIVERLTVTEGATRRVLGACFAAVVVPVVVAAGQQVTHSGFFVAGGFDRIRGTFLHSNPFAAFLAMTIVMAVGVLPYTRGRWRWVTLGVLAMASPALLLTYTRAGWIAAFAGVVVIGVLGSRKILAAALALVLVAVVAVPSVGDRFTDLETSQQASGAAGNSLSWRLEYWTEALKLSEESPISGIGLKAVAGTTDEAKQPHNDFIRAFVELGVLGLAAYVFMLVQLIRTGWWAAVVTRRRTDMDRGIALGFLGVAVAFTLMSLVGNLMSQVVLLWYLTAFAGIAARVIGRNIGPDERSAPSASP